MRGKENDIANAKCAIKEKDKETQETHRREIGTGWRGNKIN